MKPYQAGDVHNIDYLITVLKGRLYLAASKQVALKDNVLEAEELGLCKDLKDFDKW